MKKVRGFHALVVMVCAGLGLIVSGIVMMPEKQPQVEAPDIPGMTFYLCEIGDQRFMINDVIYDKHKNDKTMVESCVKLKNR